MRDKLIVLAVLLAAIFMGLWWAYSTGWDAGRADLVRQQTAKAEKVQRQQEKSDEKAHAADEAGKVKTVTITKEVIKYVQNPDRTRCIFDDNRVRIKRDAADNANQIPGYDGDPVQNGSAG